MIRTVLAFFIFAVVVCAMIIFRPFSGSDDTPVAQDRLGTSVEEAVEVTRAAPVEAALPSVVAAPAPAAAVTAPAPAPVTRPQTSDTSMDEMTAGVLAELGFDVGTPAGPSQEAEQIQTTAAILANIQNVTGQQVAVPERETLQSLIASALKEGQSDDYIDTLVNEAAASGRVMVPEVMVTSDGRVDTAVILNNLVTQATLASGGNVPVPVIDPNETAGVEVRVVQRAQDTVQARFYTVQSGDSLGSIAIKFYGRVDYYGRIFEANRQTLSSPDLIRTGQRLVIPELQGI